MSRGIPFSEHWIQSTSQSIPPVKLPGGLELPGDAYTGAGSWTCEEPGAAAVPRVAQKYAGMFQLQSSPCPLNGGLLHPV